MRAIREFFSPKHERHLIYQGTELQDIEVPDAEDEKNENKPENKAAASASVISPLDSARMKKSQVPLSQVKPRASMQRSSARALDNRKSINFEIDDKLSEIDKKSEEIELRSRSARNFSINLNQVHALHDSDKQTSESKKTRMPKPVRRKAVMTSESNSASDVETKEVKADVSRAQTRREKFLQSHARTPRKTGPDGTDDSSDSETSYKPKVVQIRTPRNAADQARQTAAKHSSSSAVESHSRSGSSQVYDKVTVSLSEAKKSLSRKMLVARSGINSMVSSMEQSFSRSGETVLTPRHLTKRDPLADMPYTVRNQAAQALYQLELSDNYKNSNGIAQKLLLNATLISVLADHGIEFNESKLSLLHEDARKRGQHAVIDAVIDFEQEPYASSIQKTMNHIGTLLGEEKGDRGKIYAAMLAAEKTEADLCFTRMFMRDYASGFITYKIQEEDGSFKEVSSMTELAKYLNKDDPESMGVMQKGESRNSDGVLSNTLRSKYISLFTCQYLSNEFGNLAFGISPEIPSLIKLYDGTPVSPSGSTRSTWTFSRTDDGGVAVKFLFERKTVDGRDSKLKDGRETRIAIQDGALATVETELYFSADRDLEISALTLHASGWNLPKDR